jgi:phosphate starvation-inducible PhoH-like protein
MARKEQPKFIKESKPDYVRYQKPTPVTPNHKRYHNLLKDVCKHIVLASGWAGSGKTLTAAYYGCQALLDGQVEGITIMRSLEGVGKDPGAYPGDDFFKNFPKLRQLATYISSFMNCSIEDLIREKKLNVCGLYDIQGQDFSNQWLIVTECQTLTAEQMYQVCTRGAFKVVLEGDTCAAQLTNRKIKLGEDGLSFLMDTIGDLDFVGVVDMSQESDIVRSEYIKKVILRMMPKLEELRK